MMAQKGKRKKEKIHFHGFTPSHGNQKGEKKLKKIYLPNQSRINYQLKIEDPIPKSAKPINP